MNTSYQLSNRKAIISTAAASGPRPGCPPQDDERDFVLPLLRTAGTKGINRNHFLKGTGPCDGRQVTQVGRLINTLEKEGYVFLHQRRSDSPFRYYVLVAEPLEPRHPAKPTGWRSQGFSSGNPKNFAGTERKPPASQPNLFRSLDDVRAFVRHETGGR